MKIINEVAGGLRGELRVVLTEADGTIKQEFSKSNLIVTVGKNFVAQALGAASPTPFGFMAVGTNVTPPAVTDTILGTEVSRVAAGAVTVGAITTFISTWAAGVGTGALTEAGIFNAAGANAGVMLSHVTFPVINKAATDTLTITWNITAG